MPVHIEGEVGAVPDDAEVMLAARVFKCSEGDSNAACGAWERCLKDGTGAVGKRKVEVVAVALVVVVWRRVRPGVADGDAERALRLVEEFAVLRAVQVDAA